MISVVLLRGVNVGGKRTIRMAELESWLRDAGFAQIATYIQSGNIVVHHERGLDVAARVHEAIETHSGLDVRVIVRSAEEFSSLVSANPYPDAAPTQLHVSFLDCAPENSEGDEQLIQRWRPEEFHARGRDVYLYLPHGMGTSVMVPRLAIIKNSTVRNWNTVLALWERSRL